MFNYYLNDNVSLQFIGGIPPKVDIKGQGEILAPLSGVALSPHELVKILFPNGITLGQAVPITNLGNKPKQLVFVPGPLQLKHNINLGRVG